MALVDRTHEASTAISGFKRHYQSSRESISDFADKIECGNIAYHLRRPRVVMEEGGMPALHGHIGFPLESLQSSRVFDSKFAKCFSEEVEDSGTYSKSVTTYLSAIGTLAKNDYDSVAVGVQRNTPGAVEAMIRDLSRLEEGWAGPGSVTPNERTLLNVETFLRLVPDLRPEPELEVDPDDGSVTLNWVSPNRDVLFAFAFFGDQTVIRTRVTTSDAHADSVRVDLKNERQLTDYLEYVRAQINGSARLSS